MRAAALSRTKTRWHARSSRGVNQRDIAAAHSPRDRESSSFVIRLGSAAFARTSGFEVTPRARPRREAEIEIARLERVFVLAQRRIVGRQRHREARRQAAVEQAGALRVRRGPGRSPIASRPKCDRKPRRAVGQRPARRLAAAARPDPAGLQQHVERALGGRDAADVLDLGARHRLVIGDDRERLDRRARQLLRLDRLRA